MPPNPWGIGLSAVGALGSVLGGSGDNGYSAAEGNANEQADNMGGYQQTYANNATSQFNDFNQDNSQGRGLTQSLINYYTTNPANDAKYASDVQRAKGNLDVNTATAANNAIARNTAMGTSAGNAGPSSSSAGVQAYMAAQDALGTNQAQTQVAQSNYALRPQMMGAAVNLSQGMANQDWSRANQSEGSASSVADQMMNFYGQQASQDRAYGMQEEGQAAGGLSGLGNELTFGGGFNKGYGTIAQTLGMGGGGSPSNPATMSNGGMGVLL